MNIEKVTTETGLIAVINKPKPSSPQNVAINGTITAPADYFERLKVLNQLELSNMVNEVDLNDLNFAPLAFIDPNGDNNVIPPLGFSPSRALLTVNKENRTIQYENNAFKHHENIVVTGSLRLDDKLKKFQINNEHMFSAKDLGKLIRFNSSMFFEREDADLISENLAKLKIQVNSELTDEDDNKGTKIYSFSKQAKTEMKLDFILNARIFKGEDKHKFKVEIMFDIRERNVSFWLESVELEDIQNDTSNDIIDREVKRFGENIIIVNV